MHAWPSPGGLLKRGEHRPDQLPAGQAARAELARADRPRVGGQEWVGHLPGVRPTAARPDASSCQRLLARWW